MLGNYTLPQPNNDFGFSFVYGVILMPLDIVLFPSFSLSLLADFKQRITVSINLWAMRTKDQRVLI